MHGHRINITASALTLYKYDADRAISYHYFASPSAETEAPV
jgi:hypothetical protein